jgi:hypothetical protein
MIRGVPSTSLPAAARFTFTITRCSIAFNSWSLRLDPNHQEIQGELKKTTRNTRSILKLAVIIHHLIVGDDSVGGYLRIRFLRLRKGS